MNPNNKIMFATTYSVCCIYSSMILLIGIGCLCISILLGLTDTFDCCCDICCKCPSSSCRSGDCCNVDSTCSSLIKGCYDCTKISGAKLFFFIFSIVVILIAIYGIIKTYIKRNSTEWNKDRRIEIVTPIQI